MARSRQVAQYRQSQTDVVDLAYKDLLAYWRTLDPSNPVATVKALEEFLPELIHSYGEVGASIAADFYDNLREENPAIRKAYHAVLGDAIPLAQIKASTRWAAGPLFTPADDFAEQTLGRVVSITNRLVQAHGRATIVTNVARDPARARYARVPSGPTTCAFCLMLASRGAVYASEDTAGGEYHGHCDCVPTPVWSDSDLPDGYDPDALASIYQQGLKESPTGVAKGSDGVLSQIREQQGIR